MVVLGVKKIIVDTNIANLRAGDTILHDGIERTVCKRDLGYTKFMGITVFGDNYRLGYKPVKKIIFEKIEKEGEEC